MVTGIWKSQTAGQTYPVLCKLQHSQCGLQCWEVGVQSHACYKGVILWVCNVAMTVFHALLDQFEHWN